MPRTALSEYRTRGPLANGTGPVQGSAGFVPAPVAEQFRHLRRLVRLAPADKPKPVDISVRVRHEYHSKTPEWVSGGLW